MSEHDDLEALVALSLLPPWSWLRAAEPLRSGIPPTTVLARMLGDHYSDRPDFASTLGQRARQALSRAGTEFIEPVGWGSASYPIALTTIADPPPLLWKRGTLPAGLGRLEDASTDTPAVAIVGARAASQYALSVAARLAADLAANGVIIVSGLARGVDSAAHRGALASRGQTIAVLGSGVDVMYPPEHAPLANEIQRSGAVLSELVPGTPPLPRFFPQRNRIISGLSHAVVVIEAGDRSGALVTARCALEQGREVLAVPGNVLTGRNRGGHGLLRDGAKIVESADDILEELGLGAARRTSGADPHRTVDRQDDQLLEALTPGEPADLDEIAERTGQPSARLLTRLFELEMNGLVQRVAGGRFVRV